MSSFFRPIIETESSDNSTLLCRVIELLINSFTDKCISLCDDLICYNSCQEPAPKSNILQWDGAPLPPLVHIKCDGIQSCHRCLFCLSAFQFQRLLLYFLETEQSFSLRITRDSLQTGSMLPFAISSWSPVRTFNAQKTSAQLSPELCLFSGR